MYIKENNDSSTEKKGFAYKYIKTDFFVIYMYMVIDSECRLLIGQISDNNSKPVYQIVALEMNIVNINLVNWEISNIQEYEILLR
jgi:hypothetical protein